MCLLFLKSMLKDVDSIGLYFFIMGNMVYKIHNYIDVIILPIYAYYLIILTVCPIPRKRKSVQKRTSEMFLL